MHHTKRLLALLLAAVMLFSASPLAYAEGNSAEETALTAVAEHPEIEQEPEETEAAEALPAATLSTSQRRLKAEIARRDIAGAVAGLTAGQDYVPNQVVALADSLEEALEIAQAYNAELIDYGFGVATLELTEFSVAQALALAGEETTSLPPIAPNLYYSYGPVKGSLAAADSSAQAVSAPKSLDWYTWVNELMENPDPTLLDTASPVYPWFHDVLNTYAAWAVTTGSPEVKVAILDTGVSSYTGEFDGRLKQIDIGYGKEPIDDEDNAHGTFVASCVAAAMDNGIGTVGMAPNVSILGYRIADLEGGLPTSAILKALTSAIQEDAWIINMSFGSPISEPLFEAKLTEAYNAGITLLCSAGNYGNNSIFYPAGYDCTISVAASSPAGVRSAFSTYGYTVDITAPGTAIPGLLQDGSLDIWDGTSFACPIAAGTAALYMSRMGRTAPAAMKQILLSCVNPSSDKTLPGGIINAAKLFSGKQPAPAIVLYDEDGSLLTGSSVPVDGHFTLESADGSDSLLIYTLDGKNPAVMDGTVVSGLEYDPDTANFRDMTPGTYTLKAASVNALGIVGEIASRKLTVVPSRNPESVVLQAPSTLIAGKSAVLTAQVLPANADQTLIWELVDAAPGITLTSKGKLTVPASAYGDFIVRVSAAANPQIRTEQLISVVSGAPAASVTMAKSETLRLYSDLEPICPALNPVFKDAAGNVLDISCSFTSSNPKVASVDPDGIVTPVSVGSATITCRALDGSNKSASCKITVLPGLEAAALSGQTVIAPGGSAKLTLTTVPANVKNVTVGYSNLSFTEGVTVSKGTVKVDKTVPVGTKITILAMVSDGQEIIPATMQITVAPKAKSMVVPFDYSYYALVSGGDSEDAVPIESLLPVEFKESKGSVTSMTLYTTDGLGYGRWAKLNVLCSGTEYAEYQWTSSNPKVAAVDERGFVQGMSNGTAKLTCTLNDGSKLKKTVTVKVVTPASSIRIAAKENLVDDFLNLLYFGKSANNIPVLGDAFGKPTSGKVTWDYKVIEAGPDLRVDHTEYFHQKKLASVSSSGKVTLSKKARDFWYYSTDDASTLYLIVYAVPQYGPKVTDDNFLDVGAQYICSDAPSTIRLMSLNLGTGSQLPYNNRPILLTPTTHAEDGNAIYDEKAFTLECDGYYDIFQCTSSDPDVATAYIVPDEDLGYILRIISSKRPGTCKVTVFTNDSAKVSKTLTVTVR